MKTKKVEIKEEGKIARRDVQVCNGDSTKRDAFDTVECIRAFAFAAPVQWARTSPREYRAPATFSRWDERRARNKAAVVSGQKVRNVAFWQIKGLAAVLAHHSYTYVTTLKELVGSN